MAGQLIKQGNIFGRIGTGIGKGLASQLPEEIGRGRLSEGLKQFEQDYQTLSPMQQIARLSAIPGVTPQTVQSMTELARFQNQANAYGKSGGQRGGANLDQAANAGLPMQQQFNPSANSFQQNEKNAAAQANNGQRTPSVSARETTPEIVNEPPLDERNLTRLPWKPDQRDAQVRKYLDQGFLVDQAKELSSDDEARDLAEPGALQKRQEELDTLSKNARGELKRQLETKLQKTGENVYKDISGDMLIKMERGMERDLRSNPKASFKDIANDWSNRALELSKTNNKLNTLGNTTGYENLWKGEETLKKLRSYSDIYRDTGNSEEYKDMLIEKFKLSPQAASLIAFPPSKGINSFVNDFKPINYVNGKLGPIQNLEQIQGNARKAAIDIGKKINGDDSFLTIARMLTEKRSKFRSRGFFRTIK